MCISAGKELVIYISMGFGNPYGEDWNADIVAHWVNKIYQTGIRIISLADTIGAANPESIEYLFKNLIPQLPDVEFGAHFHTLPEQWEEKITAAYNNGCKRFDGALRGYGGCPMAEDELVGNMPTENLIDFLVKKEVEHHLDMDQLGEAMELAAGIFS